MVSVAPSRVTMGLMKSVPKRVTVSATPQKMRKVLATAREAFSALFSPSARDTTEAPPTPTMLATPPSAMSTGEIIEAPAAASELMPTERK
ncbi:MAG: hypothetical protein BWY25_03176 [Chloroflexi bacterium ADurb.Bin222]|nr:MAG: hypothetical protein BWY25_03176 [Chloroflexi bacterium ADurb.Bin222]